MKSVSASFLRAWAKKSNQGQVVIRYKRRYWNGSAYVYEANWQQLLMSDYVSCGQIVQKLDTPERNVIKVSSVNLQLRNAAWEWLATNTAGYFGPDAVATAGYIPFLTQFQIQYGYACDDGTTTLVNLFTGVATDFLYSTSDRYVEITVSGNDYLLTASNAIGIATPLGLSAVVQDLTYTAVRRGLSTAATIAYTGGGTAGHEVVTVTGNAVSVQIQSGVSTANQVLSAVQASAAATAVMTVALSGTGSHAQTTVGATLVSGSAATTNTGTDKYTTNATSIGIVRNVYDNGVLKVQGVDWTVTGTNTYGQGAVITTTYTPAGAITYEGAEWPSLQTIDALVILLAQNAGVPAYNISPVLFPGQSGQQVTDIAVFSGSSYTSVWTVLTNSATSVSATGGLLTVLCQSAGNPAFAVSAAAATAYGVWTFPLAVISNAPPAGGNFYGPIIQFIGQDSTAVQLAGAGGGLNTNGYALYFKADGFGGIICQLGRTDKNVSVTALAQAYAPATLVGGYQAQQNWTITRSAGGQITVFAAGIQILQATDNTYSTCAYFAVACIGQNSSNGAGFTIGPVVNSTAALLTMADFTGMTGYDAVQKLLRLANYEWGFDSNGTMFARSKSVSSTPVFSIDQGNMIQKMQLRLGYAEVLNDAQVTYQDEFREYDSTTLPETAPTSEETFLTQLLSEDYSDFLLAYDPIIAAGRAQSLHDENYRTRRLATVDGYILPQVDLSDVGGVTYMDDPKMADSIAGDPWQESGAAGPASVIVLDGVPMKLIGLTTKPDTHQCQALLQEVLS